MPKMSFTPLSFASTFTSSVRNVAVQDGRAALSLETYGAFTVGAAADNGGTRLGLDLATLKSAPKRFRDG